MRLFISKYARVLFCYIYLLYDFYRFFKYSAWKQDCRDKSSRNYSVVRIYHALEKSLSLKNRIRSAGSNHCESLYNILKNVHPDSLGFHDKVAINVLSEFAGQIEGHDTSHIKILVQKLENESIKLGGIQNFSSADYAKGILPNPEDFFLTRRSLREFNEKSISDEILKKAITLAIQAPSVCNRQPWHIYEIRNKKLIEHALSLQNGNRGFGDKINHLLIITTDLKAFFSSKERYQHWIDGGIFSMSLIMALHSVGIASCCLNWSQNIRNDLKLRSKIKIENEHSVIMLLAIGYPDEDNNVCISPRGPVEDFYTTIN